MNPCIHDQIIFNVDSKTIQLEKGQSCQQIMLWKPDVHIWMNEVEPLTLHHVQKFKQIKDLNLRPKTIKLLEENIKIKLHVTGFGDGFLDMTPKAQGTKVKIDKLDFI